MERVKPYLEIKNLLFPLNWRVIFIGFKSLKNEFENIYVYIADKGEISIEFKKKKKIETSYHPEENSLELRGSRIVRDMWEKLIAYYYVRQASWFGS